MPQRTPKEVYESIADYLRRFGYNGENETEAATWRHVRDSHRDVLCEAQTVDKFKHGAMGLSASQQLREAVSQGLLTGSLVKFDTMPEYNEDDDGTDS